MNTKLPYLTAEQCLELDQLMINEMKVSVYQLMELAGFATADLIRQYFNHKLNGKRINIVCGKGNNGGDGLVAARFLANWQAQPTVIFLHPETEIKDVPLQQLQSLKALSIPILSAQDYDLKVLLDQSNLIVDALLGVGQIQEPKAEYAQVIHLMNNSANPILAIDCPTGFDATTGQVFRSCIKASLTITMAALKTGFSNPDSKAYLGDLYLADIGIPPDLYEKFNQPVPQFSDIMLKVEK